MSSINNSALAFKLFISKHIRLQNWEWEAISNKLIVKIINKNEHLLSEGEVCDKIWFVSKGLIRYYQSDIEQKERTTCFAMENSLSTCFSSYLKNKPSKESLIAVEQTEVIEISKDIFLGFIEAIPSINSLYIKLLEDAFMQMEHINYILQHHNALERYKILIMENAPELLNRVPLVHLSSYLGISPETLSRVRANII